MEEGRYRISKKVPRNDHKAYKMAQVVMQKELADKIIPSLSTRHWTAIKLYKGNINVFDSLYETLYLDWEIMAVPEKPVEMLAYENMPLNHLAMSAVDEIKIRIRNKAKKMFRRIFK